LRIINKPTSYRLNLPLIDDVQKRELVHSKLVRDSPCGWCGKKSTSRIRYYQNNQFVEVYVLGACKEHHAQLVEYTLGYVKKFGISMVVNDWSERIEREKNEL